MTSIEQFKRITHIRDEFVEEAYLPASPNLTKSVPCHTPLHRFFHSGWWVAIVCAVFSMTLLFGIIMAGREGGFTGPGGPYIPSETDSPTDTEESPESNEEIDLETHVNFSSVKAGDTVEVSIEAHLPDGMEWDPVFTVYLTYGTVPVSKNILSYVGERTPDPYTFAVTIPENAPTGQYDLTVVCEGLEQAKICKRFLSVQVSDKSEVNPYLWISTETGAVYPLKWEFARRTVYIAKTLNEDLKCWSILNSDGVGFMDNSLVGVDSLPTVVFDENMVLHYSDKVLTGNLSIQIYDRQEQYIRQSDHENITSDLDTLESGIYYLVMNGHYMGTDHTEEVVAAAKAFDDQLSAEWGWDDADYQNNVNKELRKDPLAFTDTHYCQHVLRIIIP